MPRPKQFGTQVGFHLPKELSKKLRITANLKGISLSDAAREILSEKLIGHTKEKESSDE